MSKSMFESIKKSLEKSAKKQGSSNYNDILRLEVGNTYVVRLLPYTKDPDKTFFDYYVQSWTSRATGGYISATSPTTFGERDPISEERFRVINSKTASEEDKEAAKEVRRTQKFLVNVLVVDDPVNADNNGKVKTLRYGKQLKKIIDEAITGEDAEEFGERVFSLDTDGVNLRIKVESQGDFPSYTSSRFSSAGKLQLSQQEQEKILADCKDLAATVTVRSYDELKELFNEHFYCTTINDKAKKKEAKTQEERIISELTETKSGTNIPDYSEVGGDADEDDEIRKMLDGIEFA